MLLDYLDKEWIPIGHRQIMIHPQTGAWLVVDDCYKDVIPVLEHSTSLDDVLKVFPDLSPYDIVDLLRALNEFSLRIQDSRRLCETQKKDESLPVLAVVKMAEGCNLNCAYCFIEASRDKKKTIKKETAFRIADEYMEMHADDSVKFNYCFHGGEPLLNFSVIREVVEYVKPFRDRMELSIQTNGTMITDDIARFFKENAIVVGISIDGPKVFHDKVRTYANGIGSFEKTMKGINTLRKHDVPFSIIAVLTADNTRHMDEMMEFFIENRIYDLSFSAMQKIGRGKDESDIFLDGNMLFDAYKVILEKVVSHNKTHEKSEWLSERVLSNLMKSIFFNKKPFMCMNAPCGAARLLLGFDVDGNFYACDNFTNDKDFLIGSLDHGDIKNQLLGSDVRKVAASRCFENLERCKDCTWRGLCGGVCYSADYYSGAKGKGETEMCSFYKRMIPYLIDRIDENPELPYLVDKSINDTLDRKVFITIDADTDNTIDAELLDAILAVHMISVDNAVYLCFNNINEVKDLDCLLELMDRKGLSYIVSSKGMDAISIDTYSLLAKHWPIAFQMELTDDASSISAVKRFLEIRQKNENKLKLRIVVSQNACIWDYDLIGLIKQEFIDGDKILLEVDVKSDYANYRLNSLLTTLSKEGVSDYIQLPYTSKDMIDVNNLLYLASSEEETPQSLYIDANTLEGRVQ